jgi:hypothetical protein
MALPLLPFAAKGLVVAVKYIASKGAASKALITTKEIVTTYGVGATASAAVTGTAVIGGVVWTQESINKADKAYNYYQKGDKKNAAKELALLAVNIKSLGNADFAGSLENWIEAGKHVDSKEFLYLINEARKIAMEAKNTIK